MNKMNTLDTFLDDTRREFLRAMGDLQDAIPLGDDSPEARDAIARAKESQDMLEVLRDHGIA